MYFTIVILLDFSDDFLTYPLYLDNKLYSDINWAEKSQFIREVIIYHSKTDSTLIMNNNGNLEIVRGKKEFPYWDITLDGNELTLFSNGNYLGYDKTTNKLVSDKYMKRWNYIYTNELYLIKTQNDLYISINDGNIILSDVINEDSAFNFIDKN